MKKAKMRLLVAGLSILQFAVPALADHKPKHDPEVKAKVKELQEMMKELGGKENKDERQELKQLIKDIKAGIVSPSC